MGDEQISLVIYLSKRGEAVLIRKEENDEIIMSEFDSQGKGWKEGRRRP